MFDNNTFKLMALGNTYPYCEIPSTRTGFRAAWLLFETKQHVLFKPSSKYAMPASAFTNAISIELIVSGQALPLPQDYAEIMDIMEWWGRNISPTWHQTVLGAMYFNLSRKQRLSRESLFYQCNGWNANFVENTDSQRHERL